MTAVPRVFRACALFFVVCMALTCGVAHALSPPPDDQTCLAFRLVNENGEIVGTPEFYRTISRFDSLDDFMIEARAALGSSNVEERRRILLFLDFHFDKLQFRDEDTALLLETARTTPNCAESAVSLMGKWRSDAFIPT